MWISWLLSYKSGFTTQNVSFGCVPTTVAFAVERVSGPVVSSLTQKWKYPCHQEDEVYLLHLTTHAVLLTKSYQTCVLFCYQTNSVSNQRLLHGEWRMNSPWRGGRLPDICPSILLVRSPVLILFWCVGFPKQYTLHHLFVSALCS